MDKKISYVLIFAFGLITGYLCFSEEINFQTDESIQDTNIASSGLAAASGKHYQNTNSKTKQAAKKLEAAKGSVETIEGRSAAEVNLALELMEELNEARSRIAELEDENRDLKRELGYAAEEKAEIQGQPVSWSEQTPQRFEKQELLGALKAGLLEAGLEGTVTDVDCVEFPCVIAGKLEGEIGPDVFKKLMDTKALLDYTHDQKSTSMSSSHSRDKSGHEQLDNIFGLSFYEKSDKDNSDDNISRRAAWRIRQLVDAIPK